MVWSQSVKPVMALFDEQALMVYLWVMGLADVGNYTFILHFSSTFSSKFVVSVVITGDIKTVFMPMLI